MKMTKTEFAKQLGLSRQSLAYWQKHDGPKALDVSQWREFLSVHQTRLPALSGRDRERLAKLRMDLLSVRLVDAKRESERKDGSLIPAADCVRFIQNVLHPLRAKILEMPARLTPLVAGQSAEVAVRHLRDWSEEFLRLAREDVARLE